MAPLVLHVPEMHDGIIYKHVSVFIVIENRHWKVTREHYRFANMIDELAYVTIGRSYRALSAPDPTGDFKVNTRLVEGAGWNDHFWHLNKDRTATEPMKRNSVYDLKFSLSPEPEIFEPEVMKLARRALHERALLFSLRVGFVGERPRSVWKFEQVSPFARPTARDEYNGVELDKQGIVTQRLRDVHGGRFNGIAWEW